MLDVEPRPELGPNRLAPVLDGELAPNKKPPNEKPSLELGAEPVPYRLMPGLDAELAPDMPSAVGASAAACFGSPWPARLR